MTLIPVKTKDFDQSHRQTRQKSNPDTGKGDG